MSLLFVTATTNPYPIRIKQQLTKPVEGLEILDCKVDGLAGPSAYVGLQFGDEPNRARASGAPDGRYYVPANTYADQATSSIYPIPVVWKSPTGRLDRLELRVYTAGAAPTLAVFDTVELWLRVLPDDSF